MKKFLLIIFLLITQIYSQVNYDTLKIQNITNNVRYFKVNVTSIPWSINILEVDLSNPYLKIKTAKANDKLIGNETTSSMAKRNSFKNHNVVAAVNGDFYYKGGIPTNLQIINGQILTTPITRSVILFDAHSKPSINIVNYEGKIFAKKHEIKIHGINVPRKENQNILYNKYFGDSTLTNSNGFEILVQRINNWTVNDTFKVIVKKIQVGLGNIKIPDTTFAVISSSDYENKIIKYISIGDTLKILNTIKPTNGIIKEAIGGLIQLVKDGKNFVDESFKKERKPSFTYVRHPRTAIGYSKDLTKVYFVVVDGRQSSSAGMTLPELAELMLNIGSYNAINLDGGGSSTMYVQGEIKNNPSDGTERAVSNAILIVDTK